MGTWPVAVEHEDDEPDVDQTAIADSASTVIQSGRDTLIAGRDLHHNSAAVAGAIGVGGAGRRHRDRRRGGERRHHRGTTATGLGTVVSTKMIVAGALVATTNARFSFAYRSCAVRATSNPDFPVVVAGSRTPLTG
ncbi:hypothetical protein AB0H12_21695 [Actinosynnema sp. NPDC023794]